MAWINEEYLALDHSPAALRRFGRTTGSALILLGALLIWRHRVAGWPVVAVGSGVLLAAWLGPIALKYFHRVWMTLALVMGFVMTSVLLTIVFFAVVTPVALVQRLVGKRALDLAFRTGARSYWETRSGGRPTPADYEKQF